MPITTRLLATASLLTFTLLIQITAHAAPERGLTKSLVRSQYGSPSREVAPVGQPPISRWIYGDFTVYFEGDHVIHVVQHQRTLTTPPVSQPTPAPASASNTPAEQQTTAAVAETASVPVTATPVTEAQPSEPEAPPVTQEPAFQFDPVTGRLVLVGAETEAPAETTPDASAQTPETTVPESAPEPEAPAPVMEEEAPAAETPSPAAAPPPAQEAAQTPASSEASTEPATGDTNENTRFRFDPTTGKIVIAED